ncbi:hypothetical protein MKX01_033541 [Papaver californicum]|nr:hypothetical protein MKX01_033541 [Papaver californicum]
MVSVKPEQDRNQNKRSFQNPNKLPLGPNRIKTKKKKKKDNEINGTKRRKNQKILLLPIFLLPNSCIFKSPEDLKQDAGSLHKHMKVAFGKSWKAELCEGQISEGKIDAGNPAVLVISTSALRALEFLSIRKTNFPRVNIPSGTPSRIKKLIDIDALGLSRLAVIVLDMHTDTKGYSLLTLPQVSNEFWNLYKTHFEQPLIRGDFRICLYGPISCGSEVKSTDEPHDD